MWWALIFIAGNNVHSGGGVTRVGIYDKVESCEVAGKSLEKQINGFLFYGKYACVEVDYK